MDLNVTLNTSVKITGDSNGKTKKEIYLSHLNKTIYVDVPNSIVSGTVLRLKGLGKISATGEKGDLYLKFDNVEYVNANEKYCINCGQKLTEEARFCAGCGSPVGIANNNTQRKQEWAGSIIKCPNCNDNIPSFTAICPSCGLELRNTKASSSVREFAMKLEEIEKTRPSKSFSFKRRIEEQTEISSTDMKKISLIKSFAIPNTKEDILEFMILATSNIDMSMYSSLDTPTAAAKAMNEAWNTKIKQVYTKAKNTYKSDEDFSKIQELYDSCHVDIKKQKKKKIIKWVLLVGWIPLLWAIFLIPLTISSPKDEDEEIKRLDAILIKVQDALEKKNISML